MAKENRFETTSVFVSSHQQWDVEMRKILQEHMRGLDKDLDVLHVQIMANGVIVFNIPRCSIFSLFDATEAPCTDDITRAGHNAVVEYGKCEDSQRAIRELNGTQLGNRFGRSRIVVREDRDQVLKFHKVFCEKQFRAAKFADAFNSKLSSVPALAGTAPRVSFLACAVYIVNSQKEGRKAVLVEKQLDPIKYKKWNGNNGFVDGQNNLKQDPDQSSVLLYIMEASEDEQDDDNDDTARTYIHDRQELLREIPQAFSLFTYRYTKRKMLVCDLQGVLDTSQSPPLFEFTDPVIHCSSRSGDCCRKCIHPCYVDGISPCCVDNPAADPEICFWATYQVARMYMDGQTWARRECTCFCRRTSVESSAACSVVLGCQQRGAPLVMLLWVILRRPPMTLALTDLGVCVFWAVA